MEVINKQEQTSGNEEKNATQHVQVNICENEDNDSVNVASAMKCEENYSSSEEKIVMLNIRDRIAKFKYIDSDSDSKDLDTLLKELSEIYEELNNMKTIVECLISENSNINLDVGQVVLCDIQDGISYIDNIFEDVCSRRDDYVDNTTQLSINVDELHLKVATFVDKIGAITEDINSEDNASTNSSEELTLKRRVLMYFTLTVAIVFSLLDVGTDVFLMRQYFNSEKYLYGTLTMLFVWVPALFNTYLLYYICGDYNNTWLYQLRKNKWCLIILYIVPIASVVVALSNFSLLWKKKMNKVDCQDKTKYLLGLQLWESFMEALPQLTLQLYIVLNNVEQVTQDTSSINMLRWCSMAMSAFTVARVQYSFATSDADNIGVVEAAAQITSTLFLIVSRVFVVSMGFTVTPTVTGVCLLLHWSVAAVPWYRWYREQQRTVTGSILVSAVNATRDIFYCNWFSYNTVIYRKLSVRMFAYTMYTLQCVLFTTLWCVLESNTHGTVWYYVVPAVSVLLYILCVPLVLLQGYFTIKRWAARQRQRTNQL